MSLKTTNLYIIEVSLGKGSSKLGQSLACLVILITFHAHLIKPEH